MSPQLTTRKVLSATVDVQRRVDHGLFLAA